MGINRGPNIVKNGRVLSLDAGTKRSYPQSGDVWYDITGDADGTLRNGLTYSIESGSLNYDGASDFIEIDYTGDFTSDTFTIDYVAKHDGLRDSRRTMVGFSSGSDYAYKTFCTQIWDSDTQFLFFIGNNTSYTSGAFSVSAFQNWNHFSISISPTFVKTYVNGSIVNTNTAATLRGVFDKIWLGSRKGQLWKGWIPTFHLYTRELSANEVRQNYNATKKRFT